MIHVIVLATSKIVWMNYSATGCITCHRIPSIKVSDTLFIIASFHYTTKMNPFIIALDSSLNVKWYKAFSHSLDNLGIVSMTLIDDTLIALSGGYEAGSNTDPNFPRCPNPNCSFWGLFNLKSKNFVWAKYRTTPFYTINRMAATSIVFDGNSTLIVGAQNSGAGGSWFARFDLSGNLVWQKNITNGEVMSGVFDGSHFVFTTLDLTSKDIGILKMDANGNLVFYRKYNFGASEYPYKLILDVDGYVVVGIRCSDGGHVDCGNTSSDDILVFKTDFSGNVLWAKTYSSSVPGWSSEDRAYNISFDYDGNYLVSGFVRANSNTSYPIVLKIDRNNGNLMWVRVWLNPPPNTNSNEAKGIISISSGKFYLLTYIGNGTDASGGLAIIREDTSLASGCISLNTNFQGNNISYTWYIPSNSIYNASYSISNLTLTPYTPSINQTTSCEITPLSSSESSCNYFKVLKGKLILDLPYRMKVSIYSIDGKPVYSSLLSGKLTLSLKPGLYILKLGKESFKVFVP